MEKKITIIVTDLTIEELCELFNVIEKLDCEIEPHDYDYLMNGRSWN